MRAMTSLKLSRSIWMNLRSFSGLSGLGGVAREIAEHAHHERQLLLNRGVAGFDLVFDVDAGFADPLQFVVNTGR